MLFLKYDKIFCGRSIGYSRWMLNLVREFYNAFFTIPQVTTLYKTLNFEYSFYVRNAYIFIGVLLLLGFSDVFLGGMSLRENQAKKYSPFALIVLFITFIFGGMYILFSVSSTIIPLYNLMNSL